MLTSESLWLSATRVARTREHRVLRESLLSGIKLWGVRRVQLRTVVAVAGVTALVAFIGVLHWAAGLAVAGGVVVAVLVVLRPTPLIAPKATGQGWAFGGECLGFRSVSEVLERKPREVVERLAARYKPGHMVEMVLWIVATDGTGQPWTLVQDRFGGPIPSITASAVGLVPGACDPYLEAQRLARAETSLALADILVAGWGTDTSLDAHRDVILVIGTTSSAAGSLSEHEYESGGRQSHLVELHPDSVARSLSTVDARRWQAGAVRGLVECVNLLYPGSGPLLEELVTEPWRSRRMFTRVGRLTDPSRDADFPRLGPVGPVVLKVVGGEITEESEERTPIRHDRALSWEGTPRTLPTRYG